MQTESGTSAQDIKARAQEEIKKEFDRVAIDAEKARIRARGNLSLWSRFLAWLPFTITWRN